MGKLDGIGDKLREAVNASDKTIVEIAREMEIDRLQIYSWMNGDYKPNTTSLFKLCRCLNVSADWILGLSDEKELE